MRIPKTSKASLFLLFLLTVFLGTAARADRGHVTWHDDVRLSQDSQKAIILHNSKEEILILGTELKADKETEILEFIPFPSEPKVSLAKGDAFAEVARLIAKKGLLFQTDDFEPTRGRDGSGGAATEPVEIRFSEKIGLHDVTAIKINDIEHFSQWLETFFKSKGVAADKARMSRVYDNARDYLKRGYRYFVFDSVTISQKVRFLEPLVYRFPTDKIYYPLKTSNLIGGAGTVEMIFLLPGSISDTLGEAARDIFVFGPGRDLRLSSSAKLYPADLGPIVGPDPFFPASAKIYMQALVYRGEYDFKDDFTFNLDKLVPYAFRYSKEGFMFDTNFCLPPLTKGEVRDFQEAFCQQDHSRDKIYVDRLAIGCPGFIPNDEYEVFAALFSKGKLSGIPSRTVVLEPTTAKEQYRGKNVDTSIEQPIAKSFNDNNKIAYTLDDLFPTDGKTKIRVRTEEDKKNPFLKGRTYVSRAGFNKERTKALVYVEHIAGPRAGVGYFVSLEKTDQGWDVTGSHLGRMY